MKTILYYSGLDKAHGYEFNILDVVDGPMGPDEIRPEVFKGRLNVREPALAYEIANAMGWEVEEK